jgi:NH3-dependent NAD+ synthetase
VIAAIKNGLRKLTNTIANEPVVVVSGGIQSAVVWLFTYVSTDWDPSVHAQQLAGLATAAAVAISWVSRQFVSPTRKLLVTQKSAAGQAVVVTEVTK